MDMKDIMEFTDRNPFLSFLIIIGVFNVLCHMFDALGKLGGK